MPSFRLPRLGLLLFAPLLFICLLHGQSILSTPTRSAEPCQQAVNADDAGISHCKPAGAMPAGPSGMTQDDQGYQDQNGYSGQGSRDRAQVQLPRRPLPPLKRTEFEIFAEDVTGHRLLTYGRTLFEDVPSTFAPLDHVPVPSDYLLGPGDELLIRAWGKIDLDARVKIDRDGQIYLPKVGTLNVAGLEYKQLGSFLHAAIGGLFKDFELNVALGQLRSIQIYVLGSARRPGAYTVGSLSTMVNALFVSGGPAATGSMRHVQLIRNNLVVTEFDIYDLMKRGDKSHDKALMPGDILFIPPMGAQVAISGSVEEPGIYELGQQATIADMLLAAGGLTSLAETRRAVLERIEDHRERRSEEFALDTAGLQRRLHDGDLLQILPVTPEFSNVVTLRGNVARPGRYTWHAGMRISDLLPSRTSLLTREYWNREDHVVAASGKHPFGDPRQRSPASHDRETAEGNRVPGDESNERGGAGRNRNQLGPGNTNDDDLDYRDQNTAIEASGEYVPGADANNEDLTGKTQGQGGDSAAGKPEDQGRVDIVRNDAEVNWHYASIERLDEHDLSPRLIAFHLGNAIDNKDSPDNQALLAGDVVTIFSRADIPSAHRGARHFCAHRR